jgi:hypothetical protein
MDAGPEKIKLLERTKKIENKPAHPTAGNVLL